MKIESSNLETIAVRKSQYPVDNKNEYGEEGMLVKVVL